MHLQHTLSGRAEQPASRRATVPTTSVLAYFDRIAIWLRDPIDGGTIATLRADCGSLYVEDRGARFGARYRQRLDFKQPGDVALQWIAGRPDALINAVEVAADWIFRDRNERDDAADFLHWHLVRRWHPRKAAIYVHPGTARTRYDARRGARNMVVVYTEAFSRVTGECCNVHLEWRANGAQAVRALGIESGRDLLDFDHRGFWEKRLMLVHVDPARLGQYMRNRRNGTRSRAIDPPNDTDDCEPRPRRYCNRTVVPDDGRDGQIVLDGVGCLQELIDTYGDRWRFGYLLRRLPNEDFLPLPNSLSL